MLDRYRTNDKYLRKAMCIHYGGKCQYCDDLVNYRNMEIDHILARKFEYSDSLEFITYLEELKKQGFDLNEPDHIENYLLCCGHCNKSKRNKNFDVNNMRFYHQLAKDSVQKVFELMNKYKSSPPRDIDLYVDQVKIKDDKKYFTDKFLEPLFLHNWLPEPLCLRDTYVLPRCDGEVSVKAVISDYLHQKPQHPGEVMEHFLFIEGLPAVGKSSLVSWLTWNYENKTDEAKSVFGERKLYVVRLRDLSEENVNIQTPIAGLFQYMRDDASIWSENRTVITDLYTEIGTYIDNSVVILDGFDELCMVEKMQKTASGTYFINLYREIYKLQKNCKFIITTRPGYVDIARMDIPQNVRTNVNLQPFNANDRKRWIERYEAKTNLNPQLRQVLVSKQNEKIEGLLQIPLALYMAASYNNPIDQNVNIWKLYDEMFHEAAYRRPYSIDTHPMSAKYDKEDLFNLTSEIAWEIFQSDELFITGEQLMNKSVLREMIQRLSNKYNESERTLLEKCIGISSYFSMRSLNDSYAVEFCHNNIQDYFCCEKIYREINSLYPQRRQDIQDSLSPLAIKMVDLFKKKDIFEYHRKRSKLWDLTRFDSAPHGNAICEFVEQRAMFSLTEKDCLDFSVIEKEIRLLPELFEYMLTNGRIYDDLRMPNHLEGILNILKNVSIIYINVYNSFIDTNEYINWWTDFQKVKATGMASFIFREVFYNTSAKCNLNGTDLHDVCLRDADLNGADLSNAMINGVDLSCADLSNTKLHNTNLRSAYLRNVSLSHADALNVDLTGATLNGAEIYNAMLMWAKLPDGYYSGEQGKQVRHLKELNIPDFKIV